MEAIRTIFIFPIRFYQRFISPLFLPRCRFYPSCSEYTVQSITRYGVLVGIIKGAWRIARCHPLCPGGFEPVEYGWPEHADKRKEPRI